MNPRYSSSLLIILGLFLGLNLAIIDSTFAVTAKPDPIQYKQPDGSELMIKLKGDEFIHWAETIDGFTLLQNKSGAYEYAVLTTDGNLTFSGIQANDTDKREAQELNLLNSLQKGIFYSQLQLSEMKQTLTNNRAPNAPLSGGFPTTGTRKLLVVLANFSNTTTTYTQSNFDNYMNQVNYNSTGSFKDYFLEVSYGQLIVNSTVTVWVTLPNTHDFYGPDSEWGQFAFDAVTAANSSASVNFAEYDNDGDGVVDGVSIIHQGPGQEATGNTLDIWSHSWDLTSAGFTALQRTFDGVQVNAYTTMPEINGTGMGTIGVMCHEFGHNLGSPDFYDTDYATNGSYSGTGSWDLMAGGSWNGASGTKPAHPNAYTKAYVYGWTTPVTLSTTQNVTLRNSETYTDVVRFNTTTANEYFLCENRQQSGFDVGIPGHGMIIYHVDGSYISAHSGANNINAGSHQGMYPVCATATGNPPTTYGTINSSGCPFPGSGSKTSFTDETTPNSKSWVPANTNLPVLGITESSGDINFCFILCDANRPGSFTSSPVSSSQINLSWTKNANNDPVIIAYNTTNTFGSPVNGTTYTSGSSISGGGTVVYNGISTSLNHSGLTANTTYYYKIWSVLSGNTYSTGLISICAIFDLPFEELFTQITIPDCWTQFDHQGGGQVWQFGTITAQNPNPAFNTNYAYLNSDAYGSGYSQNADLITPTLDLSMYSNINLSFNHYFRSYSGSSGTLSYSINNGSTWTALATYTLSTANPASFSQVVSAVSGQPQVKFKWNYIGSYAWYWAIDNISITGITKNMNVKVFLEGPFNTTTNTMNTSLGSLVPLAQPYSGPPWNYNGIEQVGSVPSGVVDWVLVELRDAASPSTATTGTRLAGWPRAFFLKTDGSIVGLDGVISPIIGNPAVSNNLYAVVRHRNHIAVISQNPLTLTEGIYNYNFSTAITQALGQEAGYKEIGSGVFGMVNGDCDSDGGISILDFSDWATSFGLSGTYLTADNDFDTQITVLDFSRWATNFGLGSGMVNGIVNTSYKYKTQVPSEH